MLDQKTLWMLKANAIPSTLQTCITSYEENIIFNEKKVNHLKSRKWEHYNQTKIKITYWRKSHTRFTANLLKE